MRHSIKESGRSCQYASPQLSSNTFLPVRLFHLLFFFGKFQDLFYFSCVCVWPYFEVQHLSTAKIFYTSTAQWLGCNPVDNRYVVMHVFIINQGFALDCHLSFVDCGCLRAISRNYWYSSFYSIFVLGSSQYHCFFWDTGIWQRRVLLK